MIAEDDFKLTELGKHIQEWTDTYLDDFEFRENQFEIIYSICENVLSQDECNPTHIIEAPTGSGKSLILIISAGVLFKYYGLKSYILCSDLSLWKQYDDFINSNKSLDAFIGRIKGQHGSNYECMRNHRPVSSGECRLAKVSWSKLFNKKTATELKFDCANFCPYVKARKKAMLSGVTLMTYQLYIRAIGSLGESGDPETLLQTFTARPIIFCDECHNIPSIAQSTFGLTIRESIIENLSVLWNYAVNQSCSLFGDEFSDKMGDSYRKIANTAQELNGEFRKVFGILEDDNKTSEEYYEGLKELGAFCTKFVQIADIIKEHLSAAVNNKDYIQKDQFQAYEKSEWISEFIATLGTYLAIAEETGMEYLVRTKTERLYEEDIFGKKTKSKYPISLSFGYAKENVLVQEYFLASASHHVLTSATIGGLHSFCDNTGIEDPKFDCLPSTFDYSNSPIYYLGRWKMSNAFKEKSFPYIKKAIYELCDRFKNQKGIIQTWTYQNAKEIYEEAPDELKSRMLLYDGSKAKQEIIEYHKETEVPTIVIGPTLNEGIDLPGDECRFIILMKMPYPYLGDNLVKAKVKLFPEWYDNETAKTVIQAIGRGNRFHDDWCATYILDGCFGALYKKTIDQFPMNIRNRIQFYA